MIPTETAESLGDTRCQLKASPDICIERERFGVECTER